jgi:hypothetical protein
MKFSVKVITVGARDSKKFYKLKKNVIDISTSLDRKSEIIILNDTEIEDREKILSCIKFNKTCFKTLYTQI